MKKIIRLTESDLHNMIKHSVKKILKEENETLFLQSIAQSIVNGEKIDANLEDNEIEVEVQDYLININFDVEPNVHYVPGSRSLDRDVPDDASEIVEDGLPKVYVKQIIYYDDYNDEHVIQDNGIVANALAKKIVLDYDELYDYYEYDDGDPLTKWKEDKEYEMMRNMG